jgi:hypothetical protein
MGHTIVLRPKRFSSGLPLTSAVCGTILQGTKMATTLKETLAQLETLGNEKVHTQNSKNGAGNVQHQFEAEPYQGVVFI